MSYEFRGITCDTLEEVIALQQAFECHPAGKGRAEDDGVDYDNDEDEDLEPVVLRAVPTTKKPFPLGLCYIGVLNVMLEYGEPLTSRAISELLSEDVTSGAVSNRLSRLQSLGLVRRVDGHWIWELTGVHNQYFIIPA